DRARGGPCEGIMKQTRCREAAGSAAPTNLAIPPPTSLTAARPTHAKDGCNVITQADLEARKKRLNVLAMGLLKECTLLRKHDDPLLYMERKVYLDALGDAIAG